MAWLHEEACRRARLYIEDHFPGARIFRADTGGNVARCPTCDKIVSECPVCTTTLPVRRYGVVGQADLRGFVPCRGDFAIPIELEVKTAKDRMRPSQLAWQAACKRLGVAHLVVRVADEAGLDEAMTTMAMDLMAALRSKDGGRHV